jgi:transposase
MIKKFIEIDRDVPIILPCNCEGWLNDNDLSRFIVDIIEQIDTSKLENEYKGKGNAAYPPQMMLALLFYCYAKGIFSSRQIERATYELIPVLYISGGLHPDHDTINKFRKRFLNQFIFIFTMVLEIAFELGIFKLGDISIDGTKIEANASKHKAMSWDYANKLEAMLQAEVEMLLKQAEVANSKSNNDTIDIPVEIERREARLAKIGEIKEEIERRAQIRYENEKAEYDAKISVPIRLRDRTWEKIRG